MGMDLKEVDRIVESIGRESEGTIRILGAIQEKFNYLPEEALRRVCETTEITPAAITGVATFYSQFRLTPAGEHIIKVCVGTACHVKGAETVYHGFRQYLDIPEGEDTDADRLFTVTKVACLGCCMLAPAVQIDDVTYGYVNTQKVAGVLRDFLEHAARAGEEEEVESAAPLRPPFEIRMCTCSSCRAAGAGDVYREFSRRVAEEGIPILVKRVGCTGISYEAPFVEVAPAGGSGFRYGRVGVQDVSAVLHRHFTPSNPVKQLRAAASGLLEKILTDEAWEPVTRFMVDLRDGPVAEYWGCQKRIATEGCGELDPVRLEDYIRTGGFQALRKCLNEMSPDQIVDAIGRSGLRGRGGAGFPTGEKWRNVRGALSDDKYVICNGDEGDPGAFMDRMILESFPYKVIEGMAIASYATGCSQGYLYIRAEYPLAAETVRQALERCRQRGLIGSSVMGTGWTLSIDVVEGAGAFVCGEETALIAAVEGRRGMPRYRPPYPSESGLYGQPTLVNNVETFSLVPWIIRHDPLDFLGIGTEGSAGTKTFALAGKVMRGGLIEVPMGTTLREIVEVIGGGIQGGRELKAVQVGGPSGGCVPAKLADTPVDYEALVSSGAIMGSGGLVVLDETDCMVDVARYFMTFTQLESCGKCTFCRVGTKRMLEILERLCAGRGRKGDVEALEDLGRRVKAGSLCGLGRTAPNPVLSTLEHFRDEYQAHIEGRCPAKKCKDLIRYVIDDDCIGCTRCAQGCPVDAIEMRPYEKHEIDTDKCIRCDTCRMVCPSDAVHIQ